MGPVPPATKPPTIPPPPPKVHPKQAIEDDPTKVVRADESDGSVEQIVSLDGALDRQEE